MQERTYHSSPNAQKKVIDDSQDLKPDLVINSTPTGIDGPPQVTPSGIVLGGNGRSMALQRAYQNGDAEGYRQYLVEHAEEFGLTAEQIQGMGHPVLIREVDGAPADTEGLRVLGSDLNKDFKKALSAIEQAVSAGKSLSEESAAQISQRFDDQPDGTLRKLMASDPTLFRDVLLKDGVLSQTDLPQYFTAEGTLNKSGKDFVENVLLGVAVGDSDLLESLQSSPSLIQKIERIIPATIELGKREDGWNIMGSVREAARQVVAAQVRGVPIGDQIGQGETVWRRAHPRRSRRLPRFYGAETDRDLQKFSNSLPTSPAPISLGRNQCSGQPIQPRHSHASSARKNRALRARRAGAPTPTRWRGRERPCRAWRRSLPLHHRRL